MPMFDVMNEEQRARVQVTMHAMLEALPEHGETPHAPDQADLFHSVIHHEIKREAESELESTSFSAKMRAAGHVLKGVGLTAASGVPGALFATMAVQAMQSPAATIATLAAGTALTAGAAAVAAYDGIKADIKREMENDLARPTEAREAARKVLEGIKKHPDADSLYRFAHGEGTEEAFPYERFLKMDGSAETANDLVENMDLRSHHMKGFEKGNDEESLQALHEFLHKAHSIAAAAGVGDIFQQGMHLMDDENGTNWAQHLDSRALDLSYGAKLDDSFKSLMEAKKRQANEFSSGYNPSAMDFVPIPIKTMAASSM